MALGLPHESSQEPPISLIFQGLRLYFHKHHTGWFLSTSRNMQIGPSSSPAQHGSKVLDKEAKTNYLPLPLLGVWTKGNACIGIDI